jgi:long-chain acyl-CoA synthetase
MWRQKTGSMLLRTAAAAVLPAAGGGAAAAACGASFVQQRGNKHYSKTKAGSYWPGDAHETPGFHGVELQEEQRLGVVIKPTSTLIELWSQAVKCWPLRRFIATKMWVRGRLGYVWASYESLQHEIDSLRHLLHAMGVAKGGRVAVISDNRYEWLCAHFATLQLGAQFIAVPTNITPTEAKLLIKSTGCRVLFVETEASLSAVKEWIGTVGELQHVLCFEDKDGEYSYSVAITIAETQIEKQPIIEKVSPDETAMIMFTAGTTGAPKGCMLSHRCVVANVSSVYAQLGEAVGHEDLFLSLCPWTVAGALTTDVYQVMMKGAAICIPPELIEGFADMQEINPTVVTSVALPFQRAYNNIVEDIMTRNKIAKDATRITIGAITESRVMMKRPAASVRALSQMLLGKFKRQFGSELRLIIILGHALTKDQNELLSDLDLFVVQTYGCVEAGGILATDIDVPTKLKALPGVELRVINENSEVVVPGDLGEVLVEAPHCMQGYFDINIDPEEAKNAVVLHGARTFVRTGDYGSITGPWLTVKGHKDVLITLDDLKVVDPLELENELSKSPFIKQIFVFGDRRPYLTALVVPLSLAISNHLQKVERRDGVPIVNEKEKADCIRHELRRVSVNLPPRQHIRRFAFVDELTHANGFMTCKWGFARQKVEKHYVHYINHLYDMTPKFYGHAVDDYDDLF